MPFHRFSIFLLIAILTLLGCSSDSDSDSSGDDQNEQPSNQQSDLPTIKIVKNTWLATELNAEIARIILEDELGFPVEFIEVSADDQWDLLASGDAHASLEVWARSRVHQIEQYIEQDQSVVHGGELGVVGKVGWYIPTYLLNN